MISTLISAPYKLARLPLVLVDSSLASRLPEDSMPRVTLDRALGSADRLAGTLLGDREIAQSGADRLERSRKLVTAARLEKEAAARREQARETLTEGREEAAAKREAAADRVVSGLDEAEALEARAKREAKVKAQQRASAKKKAADAKASNRTATVEQRKARVESAAEAKRKAAARKAKAELDDARETKQAAAKERADAERLSELAEAKKRARKSD